MTGSAAGTQRRTGVVGDTAAEGRQIVVVGMGLAVPGASSPKAFWQLLRAGTPMFSEPGERLDLAHLWSPDSSMQDRTYTRTAGFMHDFVPHPKLAAELAEGTFVAEEFTALWLRHALWQATEMVCIRPADRQLFAVGLTPDGSQHLEQSLIVSGVREILTRAGYSAPAALAERFPLGDADSDDVLPFRIARMAVAGMPAQREIVVVDTACSSSLYTIDIGARALRAGETDVALCGGAFALTAQNLVLFSKLQGLSRSGNVRALDAGADGVLFSDGAAVLALKTLARARADGDPVLGFVAGFGGSSDGRGKAIYAPNAAGQQVALHRAWTSAGIDEHGPDWIVAHATGTPTGDRTEMVALADAVPGGRTWSMASNKSLVGHSGWAAGAVSAIHALLALDNEVIPGQRPFESLPTSAPDGVAVSTDELSWPADLDRARHVGVSAMGFGGTNGHLVLSDRPVAAESHGIPQAATGVVELAIVAANWHLPGKPSKEQLSGWLAGAEPTWPATFGSDYPLPSPAQARLAPSAIAAMDRSQLMALGCLDQLVGDWATDRDLLARTGVLVGHTGPTRSALGYDLRCQLDEIIATVTGPAGIPADVLADPVRQLVRPSNEDSYPGLMPNIIAARLAQRLDLHGLNMTLDAGRDSVQSALATAIRYLRDGELDVALVLGVNATNELLHDRHGRVPAEAAIGFVLTRPAVADRLGLPVLGRVRLATAADSDVPLISMAGGRDHRDHRGAEGALTVLRALESPPGTVFRMRPLEDEQTPAVVITVGTDVQLTAEASSQAAKTKKDLAPEFSRQRLVLRQRPADRAVAGPAALPSGCLLLVDRAGVLEGVELPPDCTAVSLDAAVGTSTIEQWPIEQAADAAQLAALLGARGRQFENVRVVLSAAEPERALLLHELAFAAAQLNHDALVAGGSLAMLLLDAMTGCTPEPLVGLFGGLARSLARELPRARVLALATSEGRLRDALAQLTVELSSSRLLSSAYYVGSVRYEALLEAVEPVEDTELRFPEQPVVFATGGARGLTAQLVSEIAASSRPYSIWLLGSSAMSPDPTPTPLPSKSQLIRSLMGQHPGENLASITRRYERLVQDAERARTLAELRLLAGPGGVHYLQCDVVDQAAVRDAVRTVLERTGRIDVVVHGAGLSRSASLTRKQLSDFRAVRDVKVRGDLNLRTVLAEFSQRPALWCSVSSVSAIVGLRGEFDYCSANEYLMLAAARARAVEGRDEVAMTSGLWLESGMASAGTPGGAFLARQAEIGQLTDRQGRQFFRAELAGRCGPGSGDGPAPALVTTWLSELDWASLHTSAPGLRAATATPTGIATPTATPTPTPACPETGRAFQISAPVEHAGGWRSSTRIDLHHHRYLRDHLVDGRPAVPGTFLLEIAVEAAAALVPSRVPVALTDVAFSRFVRAAEHRWPRELLIDAIHTTAGVEVRLLSPATELLSELEHARMVVRIAEAIPAAPVVRIETSTGKPAPDAYQMPGTPVRLSGIFTSLAEPRFESDGGSGALSLSVTAQDGPFEGFLLPSLALDCLLRTAVLDGNHPEGVSAMVPTGLRCVQLYTAANDLNLAADHPEGIRLRHWRDRASGESFCAAVAPDGSILLSVSGITGTALDVYDSRTGGWRGAARMVSSQTHPAFSR